MEELTAILCSHAARYPAMQPCDAVKLIYQNEFGGGHLIRDEESFLVYLRAEYAALPECGAKLPPESIGNGMARVYLQGLSPAELEDLGNQFITDGQYAQGNMQQFLRKLSLLQELTGFGQMPFSAEALQSYLDAYFAAGCPMVSHSDAYRKAYCPAYRVIRADA